MTAPLAVELYSVRDALAKDFEGSIRRLAKMGYAGVETANVYGSSVTEAARLFRELNVAVPAIHAPLPLGDNRDKVLDIAQTLGTQYLVCAYMPRESFTSAAGIKQVCDQLNEAAAVAEAEGLIFGYHNHEFESAMVEGRRGIEIMVDCLKPSIILEVDAFWSQVGGQEPVAWLQKLGKRAAALHVKDGVTKRDIPNVAIGDGQMDYTTIIPASSAEWLIVEFDSCATDIFEALDKSYRYLTHAGLGHGASHD